MNTQFLTIQIRRGNEADFVSSNIILASGEPAYALDTYTLKIGDGINNWTNLNSALSNNVNGVVQSYLNNISSLNTPQIHNVVVTNSSGTIDYANDKKIQNIVINSGVLTLVKGSGWPTGNSYDSVESYLRIKTSGTTTVSWDVVDEWYQEPPSTLSPGKHIVLLRSMNEQGSSSSFIEGHYVCRYNGGCGSSTNTVGSTQLLLHFDGINDSTLFIDSSPNNFSIAAVGNAKISTGLSKFGGSSAMFDGDGDRLDITTNGGLALGTNDFTLEMWVYPPANANNGERILFSQGSPTDAKGIMLSVLNNDLMWLAEGDNSWAFQRFPGNLNFSPGSLLADQWNHLAITRSGSTLRLYANGILVDMVVSYLKSMTDPNGIANIGGRSNFGQYFVGNIDEVRVIVGAALYTELTYTVPASPPSV